MESRVLLSYRTLVCQFERLDYEPIYAVVKNSVARSGLLVSGDLPGHMLANSVYLCTFILPRRLASVNSLLA